MIRKSIFQVFLVVGALLISACGGPQMAKDIANQMKRLTLDYESAITAKANAERSFYQNQRRILRDTLSGTTSVTNPNEVKPVDVRNTIAYGQIGTNIQRDAILLANTLSSSPILPKVSTELIEFIERGMKENLDAYQSASQRQQQLKIDLLDGLEKIEQQSNRLKIIRLELQKLEQDPSMEDKLKQYFVIGQEVSAQIATQNEKP